MNCRLIFIFLFAFLSSVSWASDCAKQVEEFFKLPQVLSPANKGDGQRLNSMMRSQAANILKAEVQESLPEKLNWNRTADLYFTNYSSKDGKKVALVFDRQGAIRGYKLVGKGEPYYQCLTGSHN